ncbi:MAG TPA: hypothetical protein VH061_11535 [Solirubrobacteraceae bacterium]|jgi:hypothetical protein|nr:hypothetical protein [Solirubrobacteraceae bacterium]
MASTNTAPRRIAVVLDGPGTPRWQQRALELLSSRDGVEIVEVRLAGAPRRSRLRTIHGTIERRLFTPGPDALEPVPVEPKASDAGDPDLVVWLAEQTSPERDVGELLYLRHDKRQEPAEGAFRRAALRGSPVVETEVLLRRAPGTVVVERTVSGARPFSTTLSRDKALWKIAGLVARAVLGAPGLDEPASRDTPPGRAPSTLELLVRSPWRWIRVVAARALFVRPWQIVVRRQGETPVAGWRNGSSLLGARRSHLYADPVLFEHEGRHHLFCEEIPAGATRAVISHAELPVDGGRGDAPTPVLEADYHLSYPFVFAHHGEVFMIPETSAQRRVELYRATEFPHSWSKEAVLLDDLVACDATLLAQDGRLWLFVGVAETHATMLDELHLFTATAVRGPWQPHPLNPVVSDVRCARPAGAIQRWGERLVRPGQDGSRRYGGSVSFRQIDELSLDGYAEHEIGRLDPVDLGDARATHTYASDGTFEAVDLRRRRLAPMQRLGSLSRRLKRP